MAVNFLDNILKYLSNYSGKNILIGDVLPKITNLQNDYTEYNYCVAQEYCLENGDKVYAIQLFDKPEIFIFVDRNNSSKLEIIAQIKFITNVSMFLDKNLSDEAIDYLGIDLYKTSSVVYYNNNIHSTIETITNNNADAVCEKITFNSIKNYNDIQKDLIGYKQGNDKLTILYTDGVPYYASYNGIDNCNGNYQDFSHNCVTFANSKYQEIYDAIGYEFNLDINKKKTKKIER